MRIYDQWKRYGNHYNDQTIITQIGSNQISDGKHTTNIGYGYLVICKCGKIFNTSIGQIKKRNICNTRKQK